MNNVNLKEIDSRAITNKEKNWCAEGHVDDMVIRHLLTKDLPLQKSSLYPTLPLIDAAVDVDALDIFRHRDSDLLVHSSEDKKWLEVEIKVDAYPEFHYRDGSIHKFAFVETVSNDVKHIPGWLYTSEANVFCYYFKVLDRYMIFDANFLRDYIERNKHCLQQKISRTWAADNSQVLYHSYGYLIDVYNLNPPQRLLCPRYGMTYEKAKNELIKMNILAPQTEQFDPENLF